jgi:hypothetical protein
MLIRSRRGFSLVEFRLAGGEFAWWLGIGRGGYWQDRRFGLREWHFKLRLFLLEESGEFSKRVQGSLARFLLGGEIRKWPWLA